MTDSDKEPHGLWEVSLMLRLFPTELKNKNVIVMAKEGQELLVSEVKGIFGDVECEGIVIYLPEPDYTLYRTTCLETRIVETRNIRNHILTERSNF